jgi:hypothetical protein
MDIKLPTDYEERSYSSKPVTHKEHRNLRKSAVAAKSIAVVAADRTRDARVLQAADTQQ